jgi:hypothetical protein
MLKTNPGHLWGWEFMLLQTGRQEYIGRYADRFVQRDGAPLQPKAMLAVEVQAGLFLVCDVQPSGALAVETTRYYDVGHPVIELAFEDGKLVARVVNASPDP